MEQLREIEAAAEAIAKAEALLIGAGAGMSVDSGIPAFRLNPEGSTSGPAQNRGPANPRLYQVDPEEAWGLAGYRVALFRETAPHRGYSILASWVEKVGENAFVLTSNVDGAFQKAGFPEDRILEGHGSMHHLQCVTPCCERIWSAEGVRVEVDETTLRARPPLPSCPHCGGLARPNVFMFGDLRFNKARSEAQLAEYKGWLETIAGQRLVVVECGAGTAVPTIRLKCQDVARDHGGVLVRINLMEPEGPDGTISVPMGAREALEKIESRLPRSIAG